MWLAHGFGALLASLPSTALAEDAAPLAAPERRGFSFELRFGAGGASAEFTESDRPVADFEALALGGSVRFGSYVWQHVLLGVELTSSWHAGVGTIRVHDAAYFSDGLPHEALYAVHAPLGVFAEVYPWRDGGWFVGVGGGVGFIDLPGFAFGNRNVLTSGFSLDLGYELRAPAKRGPAVFARYSRWAGEQFITSDHPDGLVSRELLLGLRWSFWTPEWQ